MANPPPQWVWALVALLSILILIWATNMACPKFGRKCGAGAEDGNAAGPGGVTGDQMRVLGTYF